MQTEQVVSRSKPSEVSIKVKDSVLASIIV